MKKILPLFVFLLIVIIILVLYFVYGMFGDKRPPILLKTASGIETAEFQLHDSIILDAVKLKPNTGYTIQIVDTTGKVMTESRLSTDRFGQIPETVIWYDIGLRPCFERPVADTGFKAFTEIEVYDSTLTDKKYFVNILRDMKLERKMSFQIMGISKRPTLHTVDSLGCPRSWFLIGEEDIYVVGKNFPKNSIIRQWVVPDNTYWQDGDELKDMTHQYTNNKPELFELAGDATSFKRLLWHRGLTSIGDYDIVAEVVTYPFGFYRVSPFAKAENVVTNLKFAGFIVQRRQGAEEPLEMDLSASRQSRLVHRDNFLTSDNIYVYFNPSIHPSYVGQYADVYIVPHQTEAGWVNDPSLQNKDVTGFVEHILIQSCGNCFSASVWSPPLTPGDYDVVLDFNSNVQYDITDLIDSLDEIGFTVHSNVPQPVIQAPVCDGDFHVKVCTTIASSTVRVYRNGIEIANATGNGGCVYVDLGGILLNIGDVITASQFHSAGNSPVSSSVTVTAGGSPDYNPALWNDPSIVTCNNCYNYGCDIRTDTFAQPGYANGVTHSTDCPSVGNAAIADGLVEAFNNKCSSCSHIVALVIDPDSPVLDYHWYRLDENGRWSHKPGGTPATDLDASGNLITNPETADRDYSADYPLNYRIFCGYYCVNKNNVVIAGWRTCD
ncbi:MAG: hypothetical protein ACFFDN_25645 [Candidatus Hodarchaeota archaeon]